MKITWQPEDTQEADFAVSFYMEKQLGLGARLLNSQEVIQHRLQRQPLIYRKVEDDIRKCKMPHFRYAVIYRIKSDNIEIIAVMHIRQAPGYWMKRT